MDQQYTASCPVDDCNLTVDIILLSGDGKLLGAHQRNLEIYTEGFPIYGSVSLSSEPVYLQETSDVLRLMLHYTHNIRQPSLDNISFSLLYSLAEAVEKYMIYSAIEVCKIKMKLAADEQPSLVFLYSAKHNYHDLADITAKLTINQSASQFVSLIRENGLHDDIAFRWLSYRDRWIDVLIPSVLTEPTPILHKGGFKSCSAWPPFQFDVIKDVSQDLRNLERFVEIVDKHKSQLDDCRHCLIRNDRWVGQVSDKIELLPKYSQV